jgi:hypothetical protein
MSWLLSNKVYNNELVKNNELESERKLRASQVEQRATLLGVLRHRYSIVQAVYIELIAEAAGW